MRCRGAGADDRGCARTWWARRSRTSPLTRAQVVAMLQPAVAGVGIALSDRSTPTGGRRGADPQQVGLLSMGKIVGLAFTSALNPTLVAATTVMLLLQRPARLMLAAKLVVEPGTGRIW